MRPTPETDATFASIQGKTWAQAVATMSMKARNLERQRDELAEALAAVHAELECPCRSLQLGLPHGDVVAISSGVRAKVKQALATKEGVV